MTRETRRTTPTRRSAWQRPWLYPKQAAAIFAAERFVIIEASTKSGKTVGCSAWLIEQALDSLRGGPGHNFWWIAPTYAQARIAYRRIKRGLPRSLYVKNDSEMTLALLNGSVLSFRSGDNPDNLYGEDVYAAVIDEASRCKDGVWSAVRSTLTATRGPCRLIGNVRGKKNWAFKLGRKAQQGMTGWAFFRLTALDAIAGGVFPTEELDSAREELPDVVFSELYMAEAQDDDTNPFGLEAIQACTLADEPELPAVGIARGLSPQPPVAWGWDLGKRSSWTVGVGLDRDGRVSAFVRQKRSWKDTATLVVAESGTATAYVDSTGVGDPVMESVAEGGEQFVGFKFTAPSKQQLMEGLAVGLQKQQVSFPPGVIVSELEDMEYSFTRAGGVRYGAAEGLHDDCVMALGLAKRALDTIPRVYASVGTRVTKGWNSKR